MALHKLICRQSKDLFQAAIIQSGPIDFPGLKMGDDGETKTLMDLHKEFAKVVGCEDDMAECLRKKSAKELIMKYGHFDECNGKQFQKWPLFETLLKISI